MSIVADNQVSVNSPKESFDREAVAAASSEAVSKWTEHKTKSRIMARRLYAVGLKARAARMYQCGDYIMTRVNHNGELVTDTAQLCRDRLCSVCNWRLSMRRFAEMMAVLNALEPQIKANSHKVALLTLTVRNVPIGDLRQCISAFSHAWHNMSRRDIFAGIIGWSRNLEITYNAEAKTYHPHYHCLLIWKNQEYNKAVSDILRAAWKHAYKCEYEPVIDVREAYSRTEKSDEHNTVVRAALEAFKYSIKPNTLDLVPQSDLAAFAGAISGVRFVGYGKAIKETRKALGFTSDDEAKELDTAAANDEMVVTVMRWNGTAYTTTTLTDEPWKVSKSLLEREIALSQADEREVC